MMAPEDRDPGRTPLFAPRDMPSPCSQDVAWNYLFLIAEPSAPPDPYFWPQRRCVAAAAANEWIQQKGCHAAEVVQWFNCEPDNRVWRVVSEPGLYCASWLRL